MNVDEIRKFCLQKKYVTESFPFDVQSLVFKVSDKMFLLMDIESFPLKIAVKCDPEEAIELREKYDFVQPAYHFNKKHWIDIFVENGVSSEFIKERIDSSYNEVVKKFPKKKQLEFFRNKY